MNDPALLAKVVETIRIAVAPVFLLSGLGALLGVMTARLGRVIDRARALGGMIGSDVTEHQRVEARVIPARIKLIKRSILLERFHPASTREGFP